MKWISVKTHIPFGGGEYVVTDSDFCYLAEYNINGKWINSLDGNELFNITHFFKPDPIPKED